MSTEKIKQIISEELDKFLTEELGISEMVNDETVRICQLINNTVMTIKSEKYDDYTLRSGKLDVTLFGDFDVTIDFSFINFKTIDAFEKYVDKLNLCGYSSYIQHKIGINFFAISGEIDDKSLYDQCQHILIKCLEGYYICHSTKNKTHLSTARIGSWLIISIIPNHTIFSCNPMRTKCSLN